MAETPSPLAAPSQPPKPFVPTPFPPMSAALLTLANQVNGLMGQDLNLKALETWQAGVASLPEQDQQSPHIPYFKAIIHGALDQYEQSVAFLEALRQSYPNHAGVLRFLALGLHSLARDKEALPIAQKSLQIEPGNSEAHKNYGLILDRLGQDERACLAYENVLKLNPNDLQARFNNSISLLRVGEFRKGFADYEARWDTKQLRLNPSGPVRVQLKNSGVRDLTYKDHPLDQLSGKTIFVYNEQGNGDFIQFARFLPLLQKAGAKIVLSFYGGFDGLFHYYRNWPVLDQCAQDYTAIHRDWLATAICSLGLYFQIESEKDIPPPAVPAPDQARKAYFQNWIKQKQAGKKRACFGITCSGAAGFGGDLLRSIRLEDLSPLFALDADFVLVQTEIRDADRSFAKQVKNLHFIDDELTNFGDTAALLTCLDEHIAVDTSVAHLAGSLGVKTRLLIPALNDWRWLKGRSDSPWYPSLTLYRKNFSEDSWGPAIMRLKTALSKDY